MPSSKRKKSGHPARNHQHRAPNAPIKPTPAMWINGARIRTLPLAISPVVLGTATASLIVRPVDWLLASLCLAVAVFLQVGVNYSNDYSDGIRGTDAFRVGPPRLTGSGIAHPRRVLYVALAFFALAAVAGLVITVLTQQWWLLAVGAVAIAAAWFYTGGKRPYGYYGLGEVFVFLFFGLVATMGTTYIVGGNLTTESLLAAIAAGSLACAVLMVNNIRDIDQDRLARKRTLAVLIGRVGSRVVFCIFIAAAYVILGWFCLLFPKAPLVYFSLLIAVPAAVIGVTGKTPKELVLSLQLTSLTALVFAVGLSLAIAL